MIRVAVVVKDGLVTDAYSDNKDVVFEVIDLDNMDEPEYTNARTALAEVQKTMQLIW